MSLTLISLTFVLVVDSCRKSQEVSNGVTEWKGLSVAEYRQIDPCSIVDVGFASEIDLMEYWAPEEHEDWWSLQDITRTEWESMIAQLTADLQADGFVRRDLPDDYEYHEPGIPNNWEKRKSKPTWWKVEPVKNHCLFFEKLEDVGIKERSFAWAVVFKPSNKEVLILRWDCDGDCLH